MTTGASLFRHRADSADDPRLHGQAGHRRDDPGHPRRRRSDPDHGGGRRATRRGGAGRRRRSRHSPSTRPGPTQEPPGWTCSPTRCERRSGGTRSPRSPWTPPSSAGRCTAGGTTTSPTAATSAPSPALMTDGARVDPEQVKLPAARGGRSPTSPPAAPSRSCWGWRRTTVKRGERPGRPGRRPSAGPTDGGVADPRRRTGSGRVPAADPRLVEIMLQDSDNVIAEALARQVALARGEPASFEGAADAMRKVLAELGLPADGVELADGSGLSRRNRIARQPADRPARPRGEPGPPGAGRHLPRPAGRRLVRHLGDRYGSRSPAPPPGAGTVRAKTGTLIGVHAHRRHCHHRRRAGCWPSPSSPTRCRPGRNRPGSRWTGSPPRSPPAAAADPRAVEPGRGAGAGTVGGMAQFVDWDLAAATARRAAQSRARGSATTRRPRSWPTCAGSPTRRPSTSPTTPGCAPQVDAPTGTGGRPADWAGVNIAGLREVITPLVGQLAAGTSDAGRGADAVGSRLTGAAGRHRAGLPVRQGARPVRGLLRRPGPAAAGGAEHRRGGAQAAAPTRGTSGCGSACTR